MSSYIIDLTGEDLLIYINAIKRTKRNGGSFLTYVRYFRTMSDMKISDTFVKLEGTPAEKIILMEMT